jgi:PIN like domain
VHTMAEVYGEQVGQGLADEDWLGDVGEHGWVVLLKDSKIRCWPAELDAITAHGIRAFCLANANLRATDQAERLVANLPQITHLAPHAVALGRLEGWGYRTRERWFNGCIEEQIGSGRCWSPRGGNRFALAVISLAR